jgi:hypothetical protein
MNGTGNLQLHRRDENASWVVEDDTQRAVDVLMMMR